MSEHYPRIRIHAKNGELLIREGVNLCFFMQRSHAEVAPFVLRSLETYLNAVGSHSLSWFADAQGDMQELDERAWAHLRRELLEKRGALLYLKDRPGGAGEVQFEYYGRWLDDPALKRRDLPVCAASFWLSTEYLEKHGPERLRELALELAAPLPFHSGHAGLAFNAPMDGLGVSEELHRHCFRHPGLDVLQLNYLSMELGTRVRGAHWLTFLGQPVLGQLGGVAGLRDKLSSSDATVQPLDAARAVVTLGRWPEAGDTKSGQDLPSYRELARVLEPWTYRDSSPITGFTEDDTRRWERRFLD